MKFISFGAGAIGGYIGGSLALHGHLVAFLERAPVADELRQRGLKLEINGQVHSIADPIMASSFDQILELGPFDAGIFALKSFDTRSALENLEKFGGALPPLLCLQNGVENEAVLAGILGAEKVIAGTVTSAIGRRANGEIVLERRRGLGVANTHPISGKLVQNFNEAGLQAQLFASPLGMKWSKLLTNLPANAVSAILNMTPAEIFADPDLFRVEIAQLREALAVMQAQQIKVVDLPGVPVRLFAFAIRSLPMLFSRPVLVKAIGGGRGAKMPSFHIDLYSKRGKSEVAYLNGAVADYGERLNVPTPVNRFLTDTLLALTQGIIPLSTYAKQPQKLISQLYSTTP